MQFMGGEREEARGAAVSSAMRRQSEVDESKIEGILHLESRIH